MNELSGTTSLTYSSSPRGVALPGNGEDHPAHRQTNMATQPKWARVRRRLPKGIAGVLVLLLLLSAVTFASAYIHTDTTQRSAMQQAANRVGQPLAIPDDPRLADPDHVYPALLAAATAAHVNVYRVSAGYTSSDEAQTTIYALLTGPTQLWQGIPLDRGEPLSATDTQSTGRFLATTSAATVDQVGVLHDFGGNDLVSVRALRSAFVALPVAGHYQVEAPDKTSYATFVHLFAQQAAQGAGGTAGPLPDSMFTEVTCF